MADACPPSYESHAYIPVCPVTLQKWNKRALLKNCSSFPQTCKRPLEYHCLLNAYRNRSIEVCAPKTRLVQQYCPSYSLNAQRITDQYNCSTLFPDCPKHQYYSTDVLNYTGCLQEIHNGEGPNSITTSSHSVDQTATKINSSQHTTPNFFPTIIPKAENNQNLYLLFLLLIIPLAGFMVAYLWKKRRGSAAKHKRAKGNRWRDSEGNNVNDCCIMLRRIVNQLPNMTDQNETLDASGNDVLPSRTERHCPLNDENTNIKQPLLQVSKIATNPTQNSLESEDKCEKSTNDKATEDACNNEYDEVHCKGDEIRSEHKLKSETETRTFINQNKPDFNNEKENMEPSEKEHKSEKDPEKYSYEERGKNRNESTGKTVSKHCETRDFIEDDGLRNDMVNGDHLATDLENPTNSIDGEQEFIDDVQKCTGALNDSYPSPIQNDKNKNENGKQKKRKSDTKVSSHGDNMDHFDNDAARTFHCDQETEVYQSFANGLNKEGRHSSDSENEKHEHNNEMGLQEEIGNLSNSFSSAFPDYDKQHTKTVNTATSTETCEGRESAINDDNQLQCTLKKMLPTVIEEVITKLGSKMSDGKEYQIQIDNQSWTPAQQREIRDIRDRIKKIEKTHNEKQDEICQLRNQISTLKKENKSLEENMNDIKKKLSEMKSEKSDEIHKLKTELRETRNLLQRKEEIVKEKEDLISKMEREIEEKDKENTRLREELKKIKENETDPDAANKKRFN